MIIAHMQASKRVGSFSNVSGNIYKTSVDYPAVSCKQNGTALALASTSTVGSGEFYFDEVNQELYVYSTDITNDVFIATFQLMFGDGPINLSWDLEDDSQEYYYEPRITQTIGFSSALDPSLIGVAITGGGDFKLINGDDYFKSIFSNYFFEDKPIEIYEYDPKQLPSTAAVLYRGLVVNKRYDDTVVNFRVKDNLEFLKDAVALARYTDDDVLATDKNKFKKRIFGKVDSIKLKSIDQIGPDFELSGTHSASASSATLTGLGSDYINEVSVGDAIVYNGTEYEIIAVSSATSLTVGADFQSTFSGQTLDNRYRYPIPSKNRVHQVAQKPLHLFSTTIILDVWFNRFQLTSVSGLRVGDTILVGSESKVVQSISLNNTVTLTTNLSSYPVIGTTVTRSPIQSVYYDKRLVSTSYYGVTNDASDGCYITLDADFEKNFYDGYELFTFSSTNWSAGNISTLTVTGAGFDSKIKPRDYISTDGGSTYYEVMDVSIDFVKVRGSVSATGRTQMLVKSLEVVDDERFLIADAYGETEDNDTSGGKLITTASQAVKKILLENVDSSLIDTASFDVAEANETSLISLQFPEADTTEAPKLNDVINLFNQTVFGALVLSNELKLKYLVINTDIDFDDLTLITKYDAVAYSILTPSNERYRFINASYLFEEVSPTLLESNEALYELDFEFVKDYIGTSKTLDVDLYVYNPEDAFYTANKYALFNSLDNLEMSITLQQNDENNALEMGQVIQIDFDIYYTFGSSTNSEKIMQINSIEKDGEYIKIGVVDLGGMFTRRAVIAEDTASDWTSATDNEKLLYGYITADNGLVNSEIDTNEQNLIF